MEEIVSADIPAPSRPKRHLLIWVSIASLVVIFISTVWLATYIINSSDATVEVSISLVVICGIAFMLFLLGALAHEIFYWRIARKELKHLLEDASKGLVPIEEVRSIQGAFSSLSGPIAQILLDRRTAQMKLGNLNEELGARVASRTEALERQLGILKAKASRDALTGLFNRRSLEEELPQIIDACRKSRRDLVAMMIDVDYFKTLNDTLGHQAGDEFLRSLGQLIRSTIRQLDSAYRYGGDEIVVLLPDTDHASANVLLNRLKTLTDGLTLHHRNLSPRPQLSIGMCALSELPPDIDAGRFLAVADGKLYSIKHARPSRRRSVA